MKQLGGYLLGFVSFFLFLYISEYGYAYFLQKDMNLEKNIILESEYNSLKNEYQALLQEKIEEMSMISKVVLRDIYQFYDEITILKGKDNQVEIGDIVYNEQGYIGVIKETRPNSSKVELLTNKNTKLSVKVQNSYGIFVREGSDFYIKNMTSKEEIQQDSLVVTSEFSGIIGGIPVAKVESVVKNSVEQVLKVTPVVDFEHLNYVKIGKKVTYE